MIAGHIAAALGAVPLAWLAGMHAVGRRVGSAWWWLAAAFGVSLAADALALVLGHGAVSQVYPLGQAALVLLVILPRPNALAVVTALALLSGLSLAWRGADGLDTVLHVAAWGAVGAAAWTLPDSRLRTTLVGFAVLAVAWVWFTLAPGWGSWLGVQWVRALLTVGLCWAAWCEGFDSTTATGEA